ncbi:hypothetical protein [Amycolatopsis sp. w19]|uniref:hypothetical protein n=1 Tax=Amycolatopsis sp. w19 TaxID=3448134 RepID=UPI003F198C6A
MAAGACPTSPPNQVPAPAITSTPVTTVTATPSTSVPPPATVTVTPPQPVRTTSSVKKSPWRCEPGYPNCTKAQSQKCRYKTSGEVQWEHFYGTLPPGTP